MFDTPHIPIKDNKYPALDEKKFKRKLEAEIWEQEHDPLTSLQERDEFIPLKQEHPIRGLKIKQEPPMRGSDVKQESDVKREYQMDRSERKHQKTEHQPRDTSSVSKGVEQQKAVSYERNLKGILQQHYSGDGEMSSLPLLSSAMRQPFLLDFRKAFFRDLSERNLNNSDEHATYNVSGCVAPNNPYAGWS